MKLKEGQRVKFTFGMFYGTGVIICFKDGNVGLEMDTETAKRIYGHSLGGRLKDNTGWWIIEEDVVAILNSPYQQLIEKESR